MMPASGEPEHGRMNMLQHAGRACALLLALAWTEPAGAQQIRAGLLTCNVSAGLGFIIGSQKTIACVFKPEQANSPARQEDYDGTITKFGLDLGITGGGLMVWAVFTNTVAGPGFLAGEYVGATGEASLGAGLSRCSRFRWADRSGSISPSE
jgi:Protein of unknown function (DUF992)